MFHHIVMFRFQEGVADSTIADIRTELLDLPSRIPAIETYEVGRDAGLSDGAWDLVVVAGFADAAGYQLYSTHPDHLPIVRRIRSLVTDRAAIQTGELS